MAIAEGFNGQYVTTANLVGWFMLEEGSGSDVINIMDKDGARGHLVNNPQWMYEDAVDLGETHTHTHYFYYYY